MAAKIASVLTNPNKVNLMLNSKIKHKGKEIPLSKFLKM